MSRVSPDLADLFEDLKQTTTALVAYGDLVQEGNEVSRIALVRLHGCSQRLTKTLDEMERIFSQLCVFRPSNGSNGS